jgi:dienelactone hydrolase
MLLVRRALLAAVFLASAVHAGQDPLAIGQALIAYDAAADLKPELKEVPTDGYRMYEIAYTSAHNERVPGILVLPQTSTGKLPCVILQHGLGGSKKSMKSLWEPLVKEGYACLAIDMVSHGDRPRFLAPTRLFDFPYEARNAIAQTVVDLRRGLDYLATRPDIDMGRIGYLGVSMGSIVGSVFCATDTRIAAAVFVVGGGNWELILKDTIIPLSTNGAIKQAGARKPVVEAWAPFDPDIWVGRISPRPVLLINGEKDTIVVPPAAKAFQAACKEPKKIVWYDGSHSAPPDLVKKEMSDWFGKYLKETH